MPLSKAYRIASYTILVEIVLNIAIRYSSKPVYVYGNIACLILLSAVCILITKGLARSVAIATCVVMAGILADTALFVPYLFQVNDWLFLLAAVMAGIAYAYRQKVKPAVTVPAILLLLSIPVKLATQNSFAEWDGRSIYYIGDAGTHLLFAAAIMAAMLYRLPYMPILLFACTIINFRDNISGDPYSFHWGEAAVLAIVCINLLWWWLRSRYAHTDERKRLFTHIIIAYHLLIAGALYIFR